MTWDEGLLFVHANNNGSERRIRAVQINSAEVQQISGDTLAEATDALGAPIWVINSITLNGVSLTVPLAGVFEARPNVSGDVNGSVSLNLSALGALDPALRNQVIDAFILGRTVVLGIGSDGPDDPLTIRLRALKSTDFLVGTDASSPFRARVVFALGVSGNNIEGSVTTAGLTLSGGSFNASVNLTAEGHLDLPNGSTEGPPLPDASGSLVLELTEPTSGKTSHMAVDVHVPTELLILLDRSGSMNAYASAAGISKWSAATAVSNLFTVLCERLIPNRQTAGGSPVSIASTVGIKFGSFSSTGSAEVASFAPTMAGDFDAVEPPPSAPSPIISGGTPIGEALVESAAHFNVGNKWARRLILLLTDGQSNTGTPPLASLSTTDLVPLSVNSANGIILHTLSYAKPEETDASGLAALAAARNGAFQATTGLGFDGLALDALLSAYLPFLQQVLPAEYDSYMTTSSAKGQAAEPGLDRLVLVTRYTPGAGTLVAARNPSFAPVAVAASEEVSGFRLATIENPEPGVEYGFAIDDGGLTALPNDVEVHEFYDLSIRSQFGIDATDAGKPARLWAKLTYNGRPIEGASVRAAIGIPEESVGALTTRFVRSGAYPRAIRQKVIDPQALYASVIATNLSLQTLKRVSVSNSAAAQPLSHANFNVAATTGSIDVSTKGGVDLQAVRGQLLRGLEEERGLDFQYDRRAIELEDKGQGLYEYVLSSEQTQNAGVYTVSFQADGQVSTYSFSRKIQRSKVLDEAPSQGDSIVSVEKDVAQANTWNINVYPVSVQGKPMGPGLAHVASFQYVEKSARNDKKRPQLVTQDNLDGSYSTRVEVPEGKLPEVALFFGNPDAGAPAVVARPSAKVRKVRVMLEKVQVLDDKDPCLKGKGELTFATSVAPNGSPARTTRTQIPDSGNLELSSGDTVEINKVIFEGQVEEGAELVVSMTGTELDWPSCLDPNDELARYIRRIPIPAKTTKFTPDDEPNDPEALADWKVWYTVEVS